MLDSGRCGESMCKAAVSKGGQWCMFDLLVACRNFRLRETVRIARLVPDQVDRKDQIQTMNLKCLDARRLLAMPAPGCRCMFPAL